LPYGINSWSVDEESRVDLVAAKSGIYLRSVTPRRARHAVPLQWLAADGGVDELDRMDYRNRMALAG
jgi:hypothetical protein